jgi:hypothetical protein
MVGSLAAAVPLPTLALAPPTLNASAPHPDEALFETEALCDRADAAAKAAEAASAVAYSAFRAALGAFPIELVMTPWEAQRFGMSPTVGRGVRVPTHLIHREAPEGGYLNPAHGWTAEGLTRAINLAVSLFGRGGQTPHRIRRWRALLPAAAVYDARHDALKHQFQIRELRAQAEGATQTKHRAHALLQRTPATTVEGLAVHARALASTAWYDCGSRYAILLQSAAAITGVALRQPDFDVPAWVSAWEDAGGRVEWIPDRAEWAFVHPTTANLPDEMRERVRALYNEKVANSGAVHLWLDARTPAPRIAQA